MQRAMEGTDKLLAINWPLAWYPPHRTARRLIAEGEIGEVIEVHYYDGNRGPLWHLADKVERHPPMSSSGKSPRVGSTKRPRAAVPCWTT